MRTLRNSITFPALLGAFILSAFSLLGLGFLPESDFSTVAVRRIRVLGVQDHASTRVLETVHSAEELSVLPAPPAVSPEAAQLSYLQLVRKKPNGEWERVEKLRTDESLGLQAVFHDSSRELTLTLQWINSFGKEIQEATTIPLRSGVTVLRLLPGEGEYRLRLSLSSSVLAELPLIIESARR